MRHHASELAIYVISFSSSETHS